MKCLHCGYADKGCGETIWLAVKCVCRQRVGPFARGIGWLVCFLGFHKREFSYGYEIHLDGSAPDDYYGTIYCLRCGKVLSGSPASRESGEKA